MTEKTADDYLEYELRLAVDPVDLPRLRRLPIITRLAQGRGRTQQLKTVYFDTLDDKFRKRKMGLRVRTIGKRNIQCIKAPADGETGGIARKEWEAEITQEKPQLKEFPQDELKSWLKRVGKAELIPRFETRITRRVRNLQTADGDIIELAIDEGNIIPFFDDSMKIETVCEVELELKSGDPASLFTLALELQQKIPLRVLHESKAERGYRMITPVSERLLPESGNVNLQANVSAESALRIILHACLQHWSQAERVVLNSDDPEGVHQLRVSLRRIDSVLKLYSPLLSGGQISSITQGVKWLLKLAGNARDLDVFLYESLKPVKKALQDDSGLESLREHLVQRRNISYRELREAMNTNQYTELQLETGRWLAGGEWRNRALDETTAMLFSPLHKLADSWLQDLYGQIVKRGDRFAKLSTRKRHKLRLDIKRLRYATEFFGSLNRKKSKPFLKKLKALQTLLGDLNDAAAAKSILAGQESNHDTLTQQADVHKAVGLILGWKLHASQGLENEVVKVWSDFSKCKPFWG